MVFLGKNSRHQVIRAHVPNGTFGEEASGFGPRTKDGMACMKPCRPRARRAKEDPGRNSQRKAGAPRPHQIGGADTRYCRRSWNNRSLPLTCGPSAGGLCHGRIMGRPPKGSRGLVAWPVGGVDINLHGGRTAQCRARNSEGKIILSGARAGLVLKIDVTL